MSELIITVDGEKITAKSGQSIIDALISSNKSVVGKIGCSGGVCGACLCTVEIGDKKRYSLACRTEVKDGMNVRFLSPDFKSGKRDASALKSLNTAVKDIYPEILSCVSCGKCDRQCVKGIEVKKCIDLAIRGDIKTLTDLAFSCVECGACSVGCPAKINHAEVFLTARRLNAWRNS